MRFLTFELFVGNMMRVKYRTQRCFLIMSRQVSDAGETTCRTM